MISRITFWSAQPDGDLAGADRADPLDLAQPFGGPLDDVEHGGAEGRDQPAGVDRANTLDHAGAEVALDAGQRVRRRNPDEDRLELSPCSRSVTHVPDAEAYSPGATVGVCPTSVTSSRSPLTFSRRTQKPLSALWNVTRSTSPSEAIRFGPGRGVGWTC